MMLSVLMPAYNEAQTLLAAVKRTLDVDYPCAIELIVVDDGSSDDTPRVLEAVSDERFRWHRHPHNQGKGAAVRTAATLAQGDYVVVLDADLEYAPADIPQLLEPILRGEAEVVYGTRTFSSHTAYSFWYVIGNKAVTLWANVLFNSWVSDVETCLKVLPLALYRTLDLTCTGFGMEAEITGKLLRLRMLPYELPVTYRARRREDGKKLTWRDGVEALWILLRVRLSLGL